MGIHRLEAAKSQSETETSLSRGRRGVVAVLGSGHRAAAAWLCVCV